MVLGSSIDELVAEPLRILLAMMALGVLLDGLPKVTLTVRNYLGWTLRLDRTDESLGIRIRIRASRRELDGSYSRAGQGGGCALQAGNFAPPPSPITSARPSRAFPGDTRIQYLFHDDDALIAERVVEAIQQVGIEIQPTARGSPWQNGLAQRWAGIVRGIGLSVARRRGVGVRPARSPRRAAVARPESTD